MSIIDDSLKIILDKKDPEKVLNPLSDYKPSAEERAMRQLVINSFRLGDTTMRKPRREFNDLSVIDRMTVDQMAFNTYQPNDGDPADGDETNAWKSRAVKPIVRNKVISIAAHATARTVFPKIFAYSKNNDEQRDAATVMRDLMEWSADQSDYTQSSFYAVIAALVNPASIVYTDYVEAYKNSKVKDEEGRWKDNYIKDEKSCGFRDTIVPVDELYIENIYEHDIQNQGFLVWRKVQSYSLLKAKYSRLYAEKFKYVKPGMQVVLNNANQSFYDVYDTNMEGELAEEIVFWNKDLDLKLIMVNGVLLTDYDNPNPRLDKQYPFVKFGYELIDEGKFFYYKSLAFKMKQDANIVNTLYPMIIDGTYLNIFSPVKITGAEAVGSDVIIPGAAITLSDPNADVAPIRVAQDIRSGIETLFKVEESIAQSSQEPLMSGQNPGGTQTAYEISKIEQNANTVLGLFIKMIAMYVKSYGELRVSDIIQYLTIGEANDIEGNSKLTFKTFLLPERSSGGKVKTRKIEFDTEMSSEPLTGEQQMLQSYELFKQEKENGKVELYKVNPELFRELKYELKVTPDILQPTSEELERAYLLEEYDRAIANPLLNQEEVTKDFLLAAYPKSKGNIDKYINKQPMMPNPMSQTGTATAAPANNLTANLNKTL